MASLFAFHRRHRRARPRPHCCHHHRRHRRRRPIRTRDASTTLGTATQAGVVQTGRVGSVVGRTPSELRFSCCSSAVPTLAPMLLPCAFRQNLRHRRHPFRHPRPRRRLTCSGASATPSATRLSTRSLLRCSMVKAPWLTATHAATHRSRSSTACSVSPSGPERRALASCRRMGTAAL